MIHMLGTLFCELICTRAELSNSTLLFSSLLDQTNQIKSGFIHLLTNYSYIFSLCFGTYKSKVKAKQR